MHKFILNNPNYFFFKVSEEVLIQDTHLLIHIILVTFHSNNLNNFGCLQQIKYFFYWSTLAFFHPCYDSQRNLRKDTQSDYWNTINIFSFSKLTRTFPFESFFSFAYNNGYSCTDLRVPNGLKRDRQIQIYKMTS